MTNLDNIFKSRDITLLTKVGIVKAMVFLVVMNCIYVPNLLSVNEYLGCFHALAVTNSVAMNTGVHVSFQISFHLFWIYAQE